MNIFYLHTNPKTAARMQCDKHVVKMVLESAQLMSTAYWELGEEGPYKKNHVNHPSAIWVRGSWDHYMWFRLHAFALAEEYTYRYNKVHKSQEIIKQLWEPPEAMARNGWTDPPLCMPDEFKCDDPVESYRNYYRLGKTKILTYNKGREAPKWLER